MKSVVFFYFKKQFLKNESGIIAKLRVVLVSSQ